MFESRNRQIGFFVVVLHQKKEEDVRKLPSGLKPITPSIGSFFHVSTHTRFFLILIMSRSAYKVEGEPLLAIAQYHQQRKTGHFESPSAVPLGVNSLASDTAALLAASSDLSIRPIYERPHVAHEAHVAANAARAPVAPASPADPLPSLDGASIYRVAALNLSKSMTSRTQVSHDVRRLGIQTKPQGTPDFDIAHLASLAQQNLTQSLKTRLHPEMDHRHGIRAVPAPAHDLAAEGAAASLKEAATASAEDNRRRKDFTAHQVVDARLMEAATARANERLDSLKANPSNFKEQAQMYAGALALAQKNSDERMKNHARGEIDLGGGLFMTQAELDALASKIVQPVLQDIDTRVDSQLVAEKSAAVERKRLHELHAEAKIKEAEIKSQQKADEEAARQARIAATDGRMAAKDKEFAEHEKKRNGEYSEAVKVHEALVARLATEKKLLEDEKTANQEAIDEEAARVLAERKQELEKLQSERDTELKPTLDELEHEQSQLAAKVKIQETHQTELDEIRAENKQRIEQLEALEKELAETETGIEQQEKLVAETESRLEQLSQQVEEVTSKEKTHSENTAAELKLLESEIASLQQEKERSLQQKETDRARIEKHIEEKVKGEHAINYELPEHLRRDVDEDRIRDTGSLFDDEEAKQKKKDAKAAEEKRLSDEQAEAKAKAKAQAKANTETLSKPDVKDIKALLKANAGTTTEKSAAKTTEPSPKKASRLRRLSKIFLSKDAEPKTPAKIETIKEVSKPVKAETKPKVGADVPKVESKELKAEPKEAKANVEADAKASVKPATAKVTESEPIHKQTGLFKEEIA